MNAARSGEGHFHAFAFELFDEIVIFGKLIVTEPLTGFLGFFLKDGLLVGGKLGPGFLGSNRHHGIVDVVGQREVGLNFIKFVVVNDGKRVFLAVDDALFQRHRKFFKVNGLNLGTGASIVF